MSDTAAQDVSFQKAGVETVLKLGVEEITLQLIDELSNFHDLLRYGRMGDFINRFSSYCQEYRGDDRKKESLEVFLNNITDLRKKISFSCYRLEDINNSYTLYRDLVITDAEGYIIANSNSLRRFNALGMKVDDEEWFARALETNNGTEYVAQDICSSKIEEQLSLIYSTAVRENSDENGKVIGAMGVYFDFQDKAAIILDEYMPLTEDGIIQDGCYSMFTSSDGNIIASTDEDILEVGKKARIPKRNRTMIDGEKVNTYMAFERIDSAIFSSRTDGYLEYRGLGWSSHIILQNHISLLTQFRVMNIILRLQN